MVRLHKLGGAIVALAATGLAWGQAPAPTPPAGVVGRIITISEMGKPPQKCQIVKEWTEANGSKWFQAKDVNTGELLTIMESGPMTADPAPGSHVKAMRTTIFHWRGNTPPPGSSVPPPDMAGMTPVPGPTILQAHAVADSADKGPGPMTPGGPVLSPAGTTIQPSVREFPVTVCQPCQAPRPSLLSRLRGGPKGVCDECQPGAVQVAGGDCCVDPQILKSATGEPDKVQAAPVVAAQPSDWRKSWGILYRHTPKAEVVKEDTPKADTSKPDPLKDPEAYAKRQAPTFDSKAKDVPVAAVQPKVDPPSPIQQAAAQPPLPPGGTTSGALAVPAGVPPGAQSVLQSGDPRYVPVPIVTLPPLSRPPQPPNPRMPQAPQPNQRLNANAFGGGETYIPPTANLNSDGGNAFTPAPPAPEEQTAAFSPGMGAFGQTASAPRTGAGMVPYGYGPMAGGMMPPGYGTAQAMMPAMPFNGAAYPTGQQMPVYQPVYQPMVQNGLYGPVGYPSMGNPYYYRPTVQGVLPAGYYGMAQAYQQPTAPAHAVAADLPPTASTQQLLAMLKTAQLPSQREWAAEKLAALDWRTNQPVVEALVQAAHDDPAATVRAACVRSLATMNANTLPVVAAIGALKNDTDARVRGEVAEALSRLGPVPGRLDAGVQPASATLPR